MTWKKSFYNFVWSSVTRFEFGLTGSRQSQTWTVTMTKSTKCDADVTPNRHSITSLLTSRKNMQWNVAFKCDNFVTLKTSHPASHKNVTHNSHAKNHKEKHLSSVAITSHSNVIPSVTYGRHANTSHWSVYDGVTLNVMFESNINYLFSSLWFRISYLLNVKLFINKINF